MPLNQMAGVLVGKQQGPVLVVGGAPSVQEEWQWLQDQGVKREDVRVIGANDHAHFYGFKPDYVCANNHTSYRHGGALFEPILRGLMPEAKLMSRHWWADYRSQHTRPTNSGMKAVQFAIAIGGNPVIIIGIHHYDTPKPYGHYDKFSETKKVASYGKPVDYFVKQEKTLRQLAEHVPIRAVHGPMCKLFGKYDPKEEIGPRVLTQLERTLQDEAEGARYVVTMQDDVEFQSALVPEGMVIAVSQSEAAALPRDKFEDVTDIDLSDPDNVRVKLMAAKRAEWERLNQMCMKVRNSGAGVRRGIADSDIVGIIRMRENGFGESAIGRRYALPDRQIAWIIEVAGVGSERTENRS